MRETWYVLEDGTPVPPGEVAPNKEGALAHKMGLVAMRDDGETPRSRGVDVDAKPFGGKGDHDDNGQAGGAKKTADMKPEPPPAPKAKKPYKTRKAK